MAERKCTNLSSLIICCGFVILLIGLVGYSGTKTDLDRLTKGYDDCGNICGRKNEDLHIPGCKSEDMTLKPKLQVDSRKFNINETIINYKCVEKCATGYEEIFNRCFKTGGDAKDKISGFFTEVSQDLIKLWPQLVATCFIAAVFSYILLILFRYAIEYIIWIIYIGTVVILGVCAIVFGVLYAKEKEPGLLWTSISFGIVMVIEILILLWFRKRIKLVAQLFKEASKALIDVTSILFEPILTFVSLILAITPFVFFMIVIETAGDAQDLKHPDGTPQVKFVQSGGIAFARFLNFIAFIWFTQFIFGCQHFVIGGTISKWYFTRDKTKLGSPVLKTFSHLVRFHLGSVCLGSMVITLVKILRMMVEALKSEAREDRNAIMMCIACCLDYLLELLERFLKYLIRNAYIIVAKDGTGLIESGKKAFTLLSDNLMDVIALNKFGDIVLVMGRLFVVAITTLVAYYMMDIENINYVWVPVVLAAIFSFLIANCFIAVFEMTVDTIFLCFCDDISENNGADKPFFMSPSLKNVMEMLKGEAGGSFKYGHLQIT